MFRVAVLVTIVGALVGCDGRATRFGGWAPPIRATPEIATLEQRMWRRLNADRAAQGLPALRYDVALADVARAHSLDMRDHDFFDHRSPRTGLLEDRMDVAGYLALEMRENLAIASSVERAQDNLLDSPGHRANIMATGVTHVGIGIVMGSEDDPARLTITQVFARPAQTQTPAEVEAALRAQLTEARRGMAPLEPHPLLGQLAREQLAALPETLPKGAASQVGDAVVQRLDADPGHGLAAVAVVVQTVFGELDLDPPAAVRDPRSRFFGLATAPGRDDRGRPRVRVLLLVAPPR